jgi:peroxiredoxin
VFKKTLASLALIAVIVLSAMWTAWRVNRQRPARPVVGAFHRSKVDPSGHSRGIVQVELMRQIMDSKTRSTAPLTLPADAVAHQIPTQDHPLVGRRAPDLVLPDTSGKTWHLGAEVSDRPAVIVFYLGFTCTACVTHLVELDAAMSQFRDRRARVLAISGDAPEFSRDRLRKFGGIEIPLLSDCDHSVSTSYGVWKSIPGGNPDDGDALHGTFIVDRKGVVRWAHVGNRPFTDIEALLTELDRLTDSNLPYAARCTSSPQCRARTTR